ncbi:MAG: hypothetical protein J5998_05855, partial [Clostridia bacterium]|nr:hypothetical protein [Clostridia bacterium]
PLAPGTTDGPAVTDSPAGGGARFGGTIAEPTFLGLTPGTTVDKALGMLEEEKGYAKADAMIALYGEETTVTRYQWPEAVWEGEPCAVRAYFAEGQTLGLSLVFERERGDEALPALIKALHAQLTEVYGESTPLAIPEEWPSMALKDLSLAEWWYLDGPRVFLVYQVRRDGTVQVEARVGYAEPTAATPTPSPMPMLSPTPSPMPLKADDLAYWTTAFGNFYHVDEHCSGMEDATRVSFEAAIGMGKTPCPICVEEYFRATEIDTCLAVDQFSENEYDGTSALNDGLSLMTDFNQPLRTGEPRGWGIELTDPNMEDFNAGSEPLNSEVNGSWSNDILTVHNVIYLKTRSAVFCEFEFSMNDAAINPWSIRITPLVGQGPLGWHDAQVHDATSYDNTIHYLLSIVMDSPADSIDDIWYVYGGGTADEHRLVGCLGMR